MTRIESGGGGDSLTFVEQINYKDITQLQVVGKGAFGVVHKGIWRDKVVAIKKIESDKERKAFLIEVQQLSRVCHPSIVKLYGSCADPVCLVMEFAEGGSLYNVLHGSPQVPYSLAHAMSWVHQTACGVAYLHGMQPKPLIHRDLKPPNLLLVNGGTILKICDFGTACDKHTYMTNGKGSAAWMAPEVFEGSNYTEKCDVFSWGIILWEVITRRKPFDDLGGPAYRIMWHVHQKNRPPPIASCPPAIERLMNACWDQDPNNRPSMTQVEKVTRKMRDLLPGGDVPLRLPQAADDDEHSTHDNESIPADTEIEVSESLGSITPDDPNHTSQPDLRNRSLFSGAGVMNGLVPGRAKLDGSKSSEPLNLNPLTIDIDKDAWKGAIAGESDDILGIPGPAPPPRRASDVAVPSSSGTSGIGSRIAFFESSSSQKPGPSKALSTSNVVPELVSDSSKQEKDFLRPHPPPKPTSLNWKPVTPTPSAATGPALVPELRLPSAAQGHRRTASAGSGREFGNLSKDGGGAGIGASGGRENAGSGGDSLYDNAYLMLEPEFQPISPATDIPESMRIFEEHKKLAKDYLQTRTEIECLLQAKKDLEKQLKEQERYGKYGGDPQQQPDSHRMLQEWRELKSENESLLHYHRNLKKQLEIIKTRRQHIPTSGTQDFEPEPGWVLVSRRDGGEPNPNMPSGRGAPQP